MQVEPTSQPASPAAAERFPSHPALLRPAITPRAAEALHPRGDQQPLVQGWAVARRVLGRVGQALATPLARVARKDAANKNPGAARALYERGPLSLTLHSRTAGEAFDVFIDRAVDVIEAVPKHHRIEIVSDLPPGGVASYLIQTQLDGLTQDRARWHHMDYETPVEVLRQEAGGFHQRIISPVQLVTLLDAQTAQEGTPRTIVWLDFFEGNLAGGTPRVRGYWLPPKLVKYATTMVMLPDVDKLVARPEYCVLDPSAPRVECQLTDGVPEFFATPTGEAMLPPGGLETLKTMVGTQLDRSPDMLPIEVVQTVFRSCASAFSAATDTPRSFFCVPLSNSAHTAETLAAHYEGSPVTVHHVFSRGGTDRDRPNAVDVRTYR